MKLCCECKHEEMKSIPPGKEYRCCKKLSKQKEPPVICMNAREEQCGPEGKHWEPK